VSESYVGIIVEPDGARPGADGQSGRRDRHRGGGRADAPEIHRLAIVRFGLLPHQGARPGFKLYANLGQVRAARTSWGARRAVYAVGASLAEIIRS